jgi:CHAT domain-containing protein/Tfp pilus assembly protein PilF
MRRTDRTLVFFILVVICVLTPRQPAAQEPAAQEPRPKFSAIVRAGITGGLEVEVFRTRGGERTRVVDARVDLVPAGLTKSGEQRLAAAHEGGSAFRIGDSITVTMRNRAGRPLHVRLCDAEFAQLDPAVEQPDDVLSAGQERTRTFRETGPAAETIETFRVLASTHPFEFSLDNDALGISASRGFTGPDFTDNIANVGTFMGPLGRSDLSIAFLRAALAKLERSPLVERRRDRESQVLNALGLALHSTGDYAGARSCYERALAAARDSGNGRQQAIVLANLGLWHASLGEYEQADARYTEALSLARASHDEGVELRVLLNQPSVALAMKHVEDAERLLREAMTLLSNKEGQAEVLNDLGIVSRQRCEAGGRTTIGASTPATCADAVRLHERAAAAAAESGNAVLEGFALNNLGVAHHASGRDADAIGPYLRAVAIYRALHNPAAEGVTLNNLMVAFRGLGNPAMAIVYGKLGVNVHQDIIRRNQALDPETQRSFLQTRGELYRGLSELLITQGRITEAEEVMSLLKRREYHDYVSRDGRDSRAGAATLTPREEDVLRQFSAISDRVATLAGELNALRSVPTADPEKREAIKRDLDTANQAFDIQVRQIAEEMSAVERAASARRIREDAGFQADLKRWRAPDVAVVQTVVGPSNVHVILTTKDFRVAREPNPPVSAADLNKLVARFRSEVMDPANDPRGVAKQLHRVVLGPIERDLQRAGITTILWSLDGTLRYAPIAALYDGDHYVAERYRNVVLTLSSRTRLGLPPAPAQEWRGLGLGVSQGREGFQPLPAVAAELHSIIRDAADAESDAGDARLPGTVLLDDAFNRTNLERTLENGYPIVHVASHFALRPGQASESYLLLGDGRLSLEDLRTSSALSLDSTELLALSACDTGVQIETGDGSEVESFGEIAQQRGARSVVASLWPVADASTADFMKAFYHALVMRDKASALQSAQLALLHGSTMESRATQAQQQRHLEMEGYRSYARDPKRPYAHPYFWAPFVLIGNWR